MQQTSLIAFYELNKFRITESYKAILDLLCCHKEGLTDYEIAIALGYHDPNKVRPRRNELAKKGYIYSYLKRECTITKKLAMVWMITEIINYSIENKVPSEMNPPIPDRVYS